MSMLMNGKPIKVTCAMGQRLLKVALNFALPEKLDEKHPYSIVERGMAAEEVRALYRELQKVSPMTQHPERWTLFGPEENFAPLRGDAQAITGYRMMDSNLEIQIGLSEDALSGTVWCLLAMLHPSSAIVLGAGEQEDIAWPLAERIKRTRVIRKTIGLDEGKSTRWKSDEELEAAPEKEKKDEKVLQEKT
ncbi:MAG: hypothetical protein ACREI9_07695 [Nitrospiraceae bacterium]